MKKYSKNLSWLIVFSLLLCGFFAESSYALEKEVIYIPYVTRASGWWSGLSLRPTSLNRVGGELCSFTMNINNERGEMVSLIDFRLRTGEMGTNSLDGWINSGLRTQAQVTDRLSVRVTSSDCRHAATLFIGMLYRGGFAFHSYESWRQNFSN